MRNAPPPVTRAHALDELGLTRLAAAGFNAAGVLSVRAYDALVPPAWRSRELLPDAQSVVVLGCGGPAFALAFDPSLEVPDEGPAKNSAEAPGAHAATPDESDPIDRFTARLVGEAISARPDGNGTLRAVFYWERRKEQTADFAALGRACGLGWQSRLGILLHPEYGPWLSLRVILLTSAALPATPALGEHGPCTGCEAPCASSCLGAALGESFDAHACSRTTLAREACRVRCGARRACIVGREHAYPVAVERRFRSAVVRIFETAARCRPEPR